MGELTITEVLAEVIGKARWLDGKVPTDKYLAEQIIAAGFGDVRAAKAEAWDEGRRAEFRAGGRHAEPINPYRTEKGE